jgi:hypothetical protein
MGEGSRLPKVTHEGFLNIAGFLIPCAVLDDGSRVLSQEGLLEALGRSKKPKGRSKTDPDQTPTFLGGENLKPLAEAILTTPTSPIKYRRKRGGISLGYLAALLPQMCEVYLKGREEKVLMAHQLPIAEQCERLLRGLAVVGITALVDEATGYQYDRDSQELRRILDLYVTGDYAKWTKRFPEPYYRELARLKGWPYPFIGGARPGVIGYLTNKLVYEKLPNGVLTELRRVNPAAEGRRKRKHHQHLTEDIGNPHLATHLAVVIGLLTGAGTWDQFNQMFVKNFGGQLILDWDAADEAAPGTQLSEKDDEEREK